MSKNEKISLLTCKLNKDTRVDALKVFLCQFQGVSKDMEIYADAVLACLEGYTRSVFASTSTRWM